MLQGQQTVSLSCCCCCFSTIYRDLARRPSGHGNEMAWHGRWTIGFVTCAREAGHAQRETDGLKKKSLQKVAQTMIGIQEWANNLSWKHFHVSTKKKGLLFSIFESVTSRLGNEQRNCFPSIKSWVKLPERLCLLGNSVGHSSKIVSCSFQLYNKND